MIQHQGGKKQKSIYFNARPSATISKPFGKIYCKELEVENNEKNKLFYETNGLISESIGRLRTEFTLKNNKHFQHHNFSNRLGKFLKIFKWLIAGQYHKYSNRYSSFTYDFFRTIRG